MAYLENLAPQDEEGAMDQLKRQALQGTIAAPQISPEALQSLQTGQPMQTPAQLPEQPQMEAQAPTAPSHEQQQSEAKRMALMNMQRQYASKIYNKANPRKL